MKITKTVVAEIAKKYKLGYAELAAFVEVESGRDGFDPVTGKIIIQFEPTWFSRYLTKYKVPHVLVRGSNSKGEREYKITITGGPFKGSVITNGVYGQASEWIAFNKAFSIHPTSALLSTSIGAMQVMGFNYAKLGFKSVNEMWDFFKLGEAQQIEGGALYIVNTPGLYQAVVTQNFNKQALLYNGENYAAGNYHNKLKKAHAKYLKQV